MTRRRSKIKPNTRQAQQNNPSRQKKQLADFAKEIVADAKSNGINKIHINVGEGRGLSKNVTPDKIIVRVPSSMQSNILKNYIHRVSAKENPLRMEHTTRSTSKSTIEAIINSMTGAKNDEDDGTGQRRGRTRKPIVELPDEIIGKGLIPKAGMDIKVVKRRGSKKPIVGNDDGTGGRHGKTPPGIF